MIVKALINSVDRVLKARLRDVRQRDLVVTTLMLGFTALSKKPVPDLDKRMKSIETRAKVLAENITVGFDNGRLVVSVTGSSESLLKEFRRGTDWYEPWDRVDEIVLAAVLANPSK